MKKRKVACRPRRNKSRTPPAEAKICPVNPPASIRRPSARRTDRSSSTMAMIGEVVTERPSHDHSRPSPLRVILDLGRVRLQKSRVGGRTFRRSRRPPTRYGTLVQYPTIRGSRNFRRGREVEPVEVRHDASPLARLRENGASTGVEGTSQGRFHL